MRAFSPEGIAIAGTAETVAATAWILPNSFRRDEFGKIYYDHCGESEVFWDSMITDTTDGKVVFVDESGNEWLEDQITLVENDNDD